ncbi:Uncharacterised protein [[Clostridium] sordellii]|uniref:type II toxin-antitoxin system RnlB family antitoxin n=1 Tax=Paraclostridium sordellii TaxID=1505 RepID=UPI0005E2EBC8|nr:type II toxin-antitoxin system RnlB family antitoxin [Paeniclostridium sordellii]CEQ21547.1 Uncharacterised protein [[Clostridium] sordellii] [Paeniclostridium sordellii]
MDEYKILEINDENYKAIVFAQSYETPLLYLDEISLKLKKQGVYNCNIVFDMLLSMGNTSERYVEATFDGEKILENTIKHIDIDKKNNLRKLSLDFFKSNNDILKNSILNSLQIKMINKGIVI